MTDKITGVVFRAMVINAAAAIDAHKGEINELNVFPVPDGDTGTNMTLTMSAGATELQKDPNPALGKAAERTANALLRGARGNSGVILSLIFRGIAKSLKDSEEADAAGFAAALTSGVDAAYKAVMKPAEGTILTVSRLASAEAVLTAEKENDIETVLERAIAVGKIALADTVNQNPVLKKAGVIDAGGKGYLYILDGMLRAMRGETLEYNAGGEDVTQTAEKANFSDFETEDIKFTYCTEFIVSKENGKDPVLLHAFLSERSDSIVIVDDDEIIKVHAHTNEPGVVLTEALTYGSLLTVKIENMKEQHTAKIVEQPESEPEKPKEPAKKYGIVAVCTGDGLQSLYREIGVDAIVTGGQMMNPSTEDILRKIESVNAETVFVLPNNKNIELAAQQCIPIATKNVVVIPTATVPQGISATLALNPVATVEVNTGLMREAASGVHTAQITYAARDSEFDGHDIKAGEYLALLEGNLAANGSEIAVVLEATAKAMETYDPCMITVFYGKDVDADAADKAGDLLAEFLPETDVSVVMGGQPVYYYLISAE